MESDVSSSLVRDLASGMGKLRSPPNNLGNRPLQSRGWSHRLSVKRPEKGLSGYISLTLYNRESFGQNSTEMGEHLNILHSPGSQRPAGSLLPAEKQSRNTGCLRRAKPSKVGAKNMASSSGCAVTRRARLPLPNRPACT